MHALTRGLFFVGSLSLLFACGTRQRQYVDGEGAIGGSSDGGEAGAQTTGSGGVTGVKTSAKGGSSATRTSTTGGRSSMGGASSVDTTSSLGGSSAVGGTSNEGGTPAAGGATATGSTSPAGGTSAVGGTSSFGGTTATGGSSTLTCGVSEAKCSNVCVNLASDANHCGACGHSCGIKSACANARCQPAELAAAGSTIGGMDVSSKGIFYTSADALQQCTSLSDCGSFTSQIGTASTLGALVVTKTLATDVIGFVGRALPSDRYAGIYGCPITGCGRVSISSLTGTFLSSAGSDIYYSVAPPVPGVTNSIYRVSGATAGDVSATVKIGDQVSSSIRSVVDDKYVYYMRSDGAGTDLGLVACDRFSGCSSYKVIVSEVISNLAAYDGKLYYLNGFYLNSVHVATGAKATFATLTTVYSGDMLVDASSIYWLNGTSIVYCALPSCTGGVKPLVTGLTDPVMLRQEGDYVYWVAPSSGSSTRSSVYRVAKP